MEPGKDIYHKQEPPLLARRKSRRYLFKRFSESAASTDGRAGAAGFPEEPAEAGGLEHGRTLHRRRRRRRSTGSSNRANLWVWLAFGAVVGVYFLLLGYFVWRKPLQHRPAPAKAAVKDAVARTVVPDAGEDQAPVIAERVAAWSKADDALGDASTMMQDGRLAQAEEQLRAALAANPDFAAAQAALAQVLFQQKKFNEAIAAMLKALAADPDHTANRLQLAACYEAVQQYGAMAGVAEWVVKDNAYSSEGHLAAAVAYMKLGKYLEASDHLRRVVSMERENLSAQNMLAQAYLQMGRSADAVSTLKKIIAMDTRNSSGYFNLAACYARQKQTQEAVELLITAAGIFGDSFVGAWLNGAEFEAIKDEPDFKSLQSRLAMSGPAVNLAPVRGAATP